MDAADDRNGNDPAAGGCWLPAVLGLLGMVWALGTPQLTLAWMFSGAQAHRYLLGVLACGFLLPVVGLLLALLSGRRLAAVVFAGALGLTVLAGARTGLLTRDSLRSIRDQLAPPTSTSVRGPRYCQEHSGGGNRCPGG
jgi:hypothetical protein